MDQNKPINIFPRKYSKSSETFKKKLEYRNAIDGFKYLFGQIIEVKVMENYLFLFSSTMENYLFLLIDFDHDYLTE